MSLFDDIDLGADDYSGEKKDGLSQFTSKPVQKKYQPFGGQMPQAPQPQYEPVDYGYEVQPAQRQSNVFDELDAYDGIKKAHGQFKQYATENERSAKHYEGLYDDFVKNEFQPFFNSVGGFGDFDNDDEMLSFIDQMKADEVKASQEEDGFFGGSSDRKLAALENLKKFGSWDSPNGLRDKFLRLKAEKDRRRQTADAARNQEFRLFEQLTNIPIPARDAMDAQLKARTAAPKSKKATDDLLNQYSFEAPIVDHMTGEVINLERTDPRKAVPSATDHLTGKTSKSFDAQKQRLSAAMRGDINGVLARRDLVKKERNLRDKGIFFSQNGLIDGRPIGLSRNDVDLLDIAEMKAAGMTSYRGKPLELALEELGGEERLKAAKIMESVYGAKSNYEDAQLAFLKVAGSAKAEKAREKMEAARDDMQKVISLAAENGLDNELFEQAETVGWLSGIGNAIKRGSLMSEMSDYTPDFLTNTLDADEMQKFIEIASEIEKLPTSSTMKRVRETKSDGFLDAMGNLLFDNPAAIPEMFVESLSSFLPATIKWLIPSAGAGAAVGAIGGPGGALAGAGVGAKASWGVASFVLEASGMALEGMQELGVDWKNPKVFAAAWTNESIRNKIQKKMVQKGVPIAAADMLTGFMAGKVMGVANHTGNAMFKGGKLLDKTAFNKAQGAVPRFTTFQKTRNAAAELGFDSTMGMSGEFLGQWAAKEPGEAWDWDAIAAEGLVGVGPGVISSALEMRGPRANYFANAPIEIGGEQTTETGTTGTVTRAGYSAPYQTFNDPESMGEYLSTLPNANPEAVEFTKGWIAKLYELNPEAMANLKIAISPRTPDANMENRGTFEARDGQTLIYLNEKEFSADPMATFMHEAGHLARVITMDEKKLMDIWSTIGKDAQLDAYAQYYTKRVGISFKDLDEATQAKVESAFNKTDNAVLAEEWFSYQFGQYLLGEKRQVETDVESSLETYAEELGDAYTQYSGTDKKGKQLFREMFEKLDLGPAPETTINQPSAQPGINPDPQTALNAMPGTPKEKSMIARALNAMAGEKLLTESPSAYSRLSRANMMAGQAEAPDDPEAIAEAAPVFDPEKSKTRERSLEKRVPGEKSLYERTAEKPSGIPKDPENAKGPSSKNKSERASAGGRELPESLGTPSKREAAVSYDILTSGGSIKPGYSAAKLRIEKAQEKEAKKKELAAKIEEKRKARRQEPESPKVSLSDNTKVVSKKVSYEQKEAGEPVKAQKEITATDKKERYAQENKKRAQGKTRDNIGIQAAAMKMVDKQMPDRRSKRDQELYRQIKKNEKLVLNKESLDKRIKEVQAKLGDNASVAGIITELLGLKKLTNLAPLSLASAIRKMVDPDASTSKAPSNQDVEDMAYEVTERIKDIKEFLRTEIARIDREIASLTQKPEAEVDYSKLDLHNKKPEVSALYVEEYIQERIKTGGSWVVIVHGKGKTNKNTVALHKQLKKMPEVDNFRLFAKGGATHVNLKVNNQQQKTEAKTQKPKVEGQRTEEQTGDQAYKLNHSLASINKDGKITIDMKAIKEDWDAGFPYLLGKDGRKGSQQKKEVFYQIDIDAFKKALKTPQRYAQFIKLHEEGHKSAGDHGKYPKDWMSPEAIRMERLANKYAFEKMGIDWRKLKVYMPKVEEELADLYEAKRRVQAAIEMIAPEEASIDWQDIPHALLRIAPGKWDRKSGRKVTRDSQPDWQPLTLGMMAKMKDFEPYVLQRFAGTGYKTYFDEKRTPQELLWDFATREFNPEFGPEVPSVPYYGVKSVYNPKTKKMEDVTRTKSEYIMILEAVKASAIFSKKSSIASKPAGIARLEENKSTGDMEESARGYPSGFMSEKGTTFAAIIAERIRAMNNKAVEEGSNTPELTRMPVYGNNPTMEDVIALRAASGRTLELLGDPSDSEAQFNQDLFDIARDTLIFEKSKEKMATPEQRKLLREKLRLLDTDSKGRPRIRELRKIKAKSEEAKQNELDKQFDYAEQEGDPFPTVSGGSSLLKSLIDIPSIKKREEFEKGFYDQILNSLTKADLGIRLRSGYDMEATAENEEAITEYLKANKTLDKEAKGRIKYLLNEMMISASNLERLRSEEIDLSESLSFFQYNPQAFNVPERLDFLRKIFKNLEKFDYGKLEDYEYLEPWREGEKIDERKGKYAHGEFQASKVFAPVFNVVEAFAEDKVRLPFENIPASRALLTGPQESMLNVLTTQEIKKLSKSELAKLRKEAADFAKSEVRFSEYRPNADGKKGSTDMLAKEAKESEDKYIFETVKSRVFKKAQQEGKFNLTGYFNQNRTTLEKDEVVVDSPGVMENADPAASFRISPLDIVEHYLAGSNPVKQMEKLQMLPSSEVKDGFRYHRQGGLGEGLLVYVFPQFIEAVYKELDIRSSSLAKNEDSKFRWNFERGKLRVDGKLMEDFSMFSSERKNRLSPEQMAVLVEPIVQAVIDARGIDIENGLGRSRKKDYKLYERDPQLGAETMSDQGEFRDDSGNAEAKQSVKSEAASTEVMDEAAQSNLVRKIEEDPKTLDRLDDATLAEILDIGNISKDVRDLLSGEYAKRENIKQLDETFTPKDSNPRSLNSDAGRVYHGTRTNFLENLIDKDGNLVFKPSSNFGGKVTGISFSNDRDTADDYRTRSKATGTKGRNTSQGWTIDIDPTALQEATYPLAPTDEIDNELFFRTGEDIVIPKGSWGATKDGIRVTSKEALDKVNSKSAKASDAKMRSKSPEALAKIIVDADNESAINEFYQYDESTDYTESDAAARELRRRGISTDKLAKVFSKLSSAEAISPRSYAESVIEPKSLNSDAGRVLTSDVNPNLKKATLLSKIAGDPEKVKEFQKWKKEKGESLKKGSFKMNFVDRADPLKQFHRGIVNILKKVGIDENHPLYDQLNVHGRLHQYFGKGYETVEQAQLRFIDPIKDLMREHGVDLKTFGEYLLARAAPSRNRQLKARADEYLADIAKEEKEGEGSDKYKKERAKYYKGDEFIVTSGIETDAAVKVVESMEQDKDFKAFAQKALPLYYKMNLEALDQLVGSGMIQEILDKEKTGATGFRERTAMIKASSRFNWSKESNSSVIMPEDIGNYSYAPMQGFENETQNYLDGEAAWEEFGAAGSGAGKGFDQPKSRGILNPAFGRTEDYNGPNPEMVFATSINQYFNNAVLAKKNEVAQSFGSMFEAIRELTHPKEFDRMDKEARRDAPSAEFQGRYLSAEAKGFLSDLQKLDDNMIAELKKEFDKIFEPDYKMTEGKKLYEYPETGDKLIQVERQLSTVYKDDPLTFVYRRDGEAYLIKLKSTPEGLRMADTMKNLRYESLPSILQFFNVGTRFMARMFTSMNPAFIIPNFFRDLGTAAIHLSEDSKKKIFKDALNFKNLGKFAKAIFKTENMIAKGDNPNDNPEIQKLISLPEAELAKSTHPLADIARYQVAKQNGAKIGYFRHASVPELIRDIQKDLKKSKKGLTKKGLKGLNDFVESSNTAIENSIRMSTYWAAIKGGYSPDEAAVIARNVTVDFNQKGNLTQALGSLYVFFGASMNSMHRFVTSWNRRSTKDKIAMFGGIAAASMTIAMMNRLLDDDEDEEVPDYDTITSYKRDTNFIVPLPAGLPEFFNDENDTGYFSIPLPLGYNLFWTMGQVAADMFAKNVMGRGGEGLIAGTTRLMESSMNAFNPIGGSTIATIGTPSLVTPLIELYANKNFMGSPIRYADRPFEVPKPAYLQDPKSTPQHWTDLSKAINEFMGGSDTVKGSVQGMFGGNPLMHSSDEDLQFDLSGNQMRHALLGFLGGPGQIADSLLGAMITGVQGESSLRNMNDIPMFNRFLRATTYGSTTRDTFYEIRDAIKNAEKAVKSAKNISPSTYTAVLNDNRELLKLSSSISQLDKQKNKMRRLKKQIEGSKTLTEEQKTQRVDDLQKKELNLMVKVIKQAQSLGIS